jgi:hypothetical protein
VTTAESDAAFAGQAYADPTGTGSGIARSRAEAKIAEKTGTPDATVQGNVTVTTSSDPEKK